MRRVAIVVVGTITGSVLAALLLAPLGLNPSTAHAQAPQYAYDFVLTGPITVDPGYDYVSQFNDETDVGCWGNYANQFGAQANGVGTADASGNVAKWGGIDVDGRLTGGCHIEDGGYVFDGTVSGGTYDPSSGAITGFDASTTETLTTSADGTASQYTVALTITGDLLPVPGAGVLTHEGDVHFTYDYTDSAGNATRFAGTQQMQMQIWAVEGQPAPQGTASPEASSPGVASSSPDGGAAVIGPVETGGTVPAEAPPGGGDFSAAPIGIAALAAIVAGIAGAAVLQARRRRALELANPPSDQVAAVTSDRFGGLEDAYSVGEGAGKALPAHPRAAEAMLVAQQPPTTRKPPLVEPQGATAEGLRAATRERTAEGKPPWHTEDERGQTSEGTR